MNAAWAREWAASITNVEKLMDMYAEDADFEERHYRSQRTGQGGD